jgi:hypothetical protein
MRVTASGYIVVNGRTHKNSQSGPPPGRCSNNKKFELHEAVDSVLKKPDQYQEILVRLVECSTSLSRASTSH